MRFYVLALVGASISATANAALPSKWTVNVPGIGAVNLAKDGVSFKGTTQTSGDLGTITFTGDYSETGAFHLTGTASGGLRPFQSASGFGKLPGLQKLTIGTPTLTLKRDLLSSTIKLEFSGTVTSGATGVDLKGFAFLDAAGALHAGAAGVATGDWNLRDVHPYLAANYVANQLALTSIRFALSTDQVDETNRSSLGIDATWGRMPAGLYLFGNVALSPVGVSPGSCQYSKALPQLLTCANRLAGNSASSVPLLLAVDSTQFVFKAGLPANLKLRPQPSYSQRKIGVEVAEPVKWAIRATMGTAPEFSIGFEGALRLTLPCKGCPQPIVKGSVDYTSHNRFEGRLSAYNFAIGGVKVDELTAQAAIDPVIFAATGLPSDPALVAKIKLGNAAFDFVMRPEVGLFEARMRDGSLGYLMGQVPSFAPYASRVPPMFRDLMLTDARMYFAPVATTIGDDDFPAGVAALGQLTDYLKNQTLIRATMAADGVRVKALWQNSAATSILDEISRLAAKLGWTITTQQKEKIRQTFSLNTVKLDAFVHETGIVDFRGTWIGTIQGKPIARAAALTGQSLEEAFQAVLRNIIESELRRRYGS